MMDLVVLSTASSVNVNKDRKRKLNIAHWKRNEAKRLRNTGQGYVSISSGRPVPPKDLPQQAKVCHKKCRHEGCTAGSLAEKQEICRRYYGMGDYEKQRNYLIGLIEKVNDGNRTEFKYFIRRTNGDRKQVCKLTFMDIHQIKRKVVKHLQDNLLIGNLSIVDKRGKHENHRVVPQEIRDSIRRHIFSYTFEPVHYSRDAGNEEYLPANLNIARMTAAYKNENPDLPFKIDWLYRDIFISTGIKLNKPKSDTCKTCDKLHIAITYPNNVEELRTNEVLMDEHQSAADLGYVRMYEDINESRVNPNLIVKVIDLQKVLFSPTLTHQDMFYMRQYSSYNLCIYDGKEDQGNMYFWNETEAHRGVNEMGSAFLSHITATLTPLRDSQTRKLVVWSDRCRGQFNNFPIICLHLYLINKGYFTEIEHKYLVSGHSYMPCDRLFGLIEKRKKVSNAYHPNDWITVIKEARPSQPFNVIHLTQEQIFDIKQLKCQYFPLPQSLKVTEVALVRILSTSSYIYTKTSHVVENWTGHIMYAPNQRQRRANRVLLDISTIEIAPLQQCYNGPLPLTQEKKENLLSMLPYLPPEYRQFYEEVISY